MAGSTCGLWTMSSFTRLIILSILFISLDGEIQGNRPKIKSIDGDLIIESAYDKNIYLRVNGPKSTVFVGEVDLLKFNISRTSAGRQESSNIDIDEYLNGPDGIIRRLERLESRSETQSSTLNISLLWRRVNRLSNRLANLQTLVNTLGRDECMSGPCMHGGTCLNLARGYHCLCPSNWEGVNCDEDVNECVIYRGTDLGCQNNANCVNTPGSYECKCLSGWNGVHCTRRNKSCSEGNFEMCGHGTCIPTNVGEGIKCICDQGWTTDGTGLACLTDVNECDSSFGPRCSTNPKVECINLPGSFRCGQCPVGYEGDGFACSDIDECLTNNGGCSNSPMVTCHNTIGSRICGSCPPGYEGDGINCIWRGSCKINRGGCHPSAQCIDNVAGGGQSTQCVCPAGMDGDGIGINGCYVSTGNITRGCDTNPCGVYGQCHPLRSGYTCICLRGYGGAHCENLQDYCLSNPCLNGGSCRIDHSSARGFRCECTAQHTGDFCHVTVRSCGGLLQAEEGSIVYPLNNRTYNHNARCAWVIQTESDKVVNVTFSKFSLEPNPDCLYDFLQIHDGRSSASQIIGRFCGNQFPKGGNIISSNNNLYLWFRSDQTVAKDGFALHWNSIDPVCGGELDARTHGQISSPGSPGKYPPNRDCFWHLTTTLGKRISLHFYSLDIEAHSNCSFDFIAIYDGQYSTDPLISKYCNSSQPAPVMSSGSDLLIHFHSDAYNSGHGFQITYSPEEGVPGCGGLYTTDKGEISSPTYEGKYLHNLICEYKIKTNPETKIKLNFRFFQLENSLRCKYDYLKIYDGPSEESRLVGRFCGNTYPQTYTSSSNQIYIKFKSDHSMSYEGFRISYETVCYETIIGDSGIIKSPGYPNNYPNNRVCEYLIGTAPGKAIQLSFQDFDIENNNFYNCRYDNVEIRDGINANASLLGKYCGGIEHIPPILTSTYNYMYMMFSTDLSVNGRGFLANYSSIPLNCGGIYREVSATISHPGAGQTTYSNDETCNWIIIAPIGSYIQLNWIRFDLEKMPSCASDFVELTEVDENNQIINLGKYCGNTKPPTITTTTNALEIKFHSDSSLRSEGFSVSYTFLDEQLHCGRSYNKVNGIFYSPGWPKRYPTNRNCEWTITVPPGRQISLNISQFELERPINDKCDFGDYLEIRNGGTRNSPLIQKLCGSFQSRRIMSMSNVLYIRFHSDYYLSGKGFKIEWDGSISGCGGTISSPKGMISSPNYPLEYHENAECFYRIVTSSGSRIRITFSELDLERTLGCRDDYVEVFDGRDENGASLGRQCFMTPELKTLESSTNFLFIKFRSDFYIGGKGFLLEYNTICENNVTGLHGIIESPGYPGSYPIPLNCLWTINVPKGNKINVTFAYLDIAVTRSRILQYNHFRRNWGIRQSCDKDYIRTKDSADADFGKKICGVTPPDRISTKGNSLQISFITSGIFSHNGFRLEWARYGCGGYIQKSFGQVKIDPSDTSQQELECEWIIETPEGTSVTISIDELRMKDAMNCSVDVIEIYNGKTTEYPLLTKICHRGASSVSSTANYMLVKFKKQSSLRDVYFSAHFDSFLSSCGGRIETLSGTIHTKNYPKNYDSNMNCMWTIVVPRNHRIEFNFQDFDLYSGESTTDCSDNVRIYDGNYVLSPNYTTRICPNAQPSRIISKNNILGVQFVSDYIGEAKGFKANFTVICGATLIAQFDGIILVERWHKNYIRDNCTWTIVAPSFDKKISLTITHMSIQKNSSMLSNKMCPSSFLRVYDGDNSEAPIIDEFCGRKVPPTIVSHGSALTVMFGAYNSTPNGEFSISYAPLTTSCGGYLTSEEGTIASPNYPQSYPPGASCEWLLKTSPGNRVYVTFEKFDLTWSENCNEDYLEVREETGAGKLLGVYCGSDIPTNTTVAAKLYIKFHSGKDNTGKGFVLHYGFMHGDEISGKRGEIASPLYPHSYDGAGEYFWRVSSIDVKVISITIDRLEIPTDSTSCYNSLIIYDGYNENAPVLEKLCGVLQTPKQLITTSNTVFIKLSLDESNSGSLFHIRWASADTYIEEDESNAPNCGLNETKVIEPGALFEFKSPKYPNNYDNNLYCEWVFSPLPGHSINLHFIRIDLEQTPMCFADYLSIYSSNTLTEWKPIKQNVCLEQQVKTDINSTNYMRVVFKTDSSIVRNGFQAEASSLCGGFMSGLSGSIEPTYQDISGRYTILKCSWTVKVRPGRVIKLAFDYFNITNGENECTSFVTIRNGDSIEAPMLSTGKFCGYNNENRENIESSSNSIFVTYNSGFLRDAPRAFYPFKLRYEEKGIECGSVSKLDSDHAWEIFTSPNYPSVPIPYSECVWVFTGPPGEILRIDFLERFDLDRSSDCNLEYVEIRDGSTDLAPLKGKYCRDRPGTIKSSNNVIYIKYHTQLLEPRNGFKANVSIDLCGGTIMASKGDIKSPGYPHMSAIPFGTVCEWRIIGSPRQIFFIKPQEIDLPESQSPCDTKVTIEETEAVNNTIAVLQTYCGDQINSMYPVETSSNEVVIKLRIGQPAEWSSPTSVKGFRFTFNSTRPMCGGEITTPEGFLFTPGYPGETTQRYCQWQITVPDKTRRIRLEILDYNREKHRIGMFNDLNFQTVIQTLASTDSEASETTVFESSGNTLAIYLWLNSLSTRHRFKARFTSEDPALCGGSLTGLEGELQSPIIDRSYTCDWHYNAGVSSNASIPQTLYLKTQINSSAFGHVNRCRFSDSKLEIKVTSFKSNLFFTKIMCGNTEYSYRIPIPEFNLRAIKHKSSYLDFHVQWKLNPCGGTVHAGIDPVNVLKVPEHFNDTIDCAWIIIVPVESRVLMKLEGSFQLSCENEFIKISQGVVNTIAEYCKDKMQDNPLNTPYRNILVQYHSNTKASTNIRLLVNSNTDHCGGFLTDYQSIFETPNYPNSYSPNMECTWEIQASIGNRISLRFIERFMIEEKTNCTKDAVIIYDWKDNAYSEIGKVCGRVIPPVFNSTFNRLKVVLRTDASIETDGFKAQWVPICGGSLNATDKEQFLYSPGYPNTYQPSIECVYKIYGGDRRVLIKFLTFELEGNYPTCEFDNITLNADSDYNYLSETYCGNELPPPVYSFNEVTLTFKSDKYIQRKGFKLTYQLYECGGHIKEPSVISSNILSQIYDSNENCTWTIEAPINKTVVVKFEYIHLESDTGCMRDYVAVYNGKTIDEDKRLALMCGFINSSMVLRSTENTMLVQFISDSSVSYDGFKAIIYFSYSSAVGCGGHVDLTNLSPGVKHLLKSPLIGASVVYENYLDCQWNIKAPPDFTIELKFNNFHIAPCVGVNQTAIGFSKCDCDFIKIVDGLNPDDMVIGKYCGHDVPRDLMSSRNLLSVHFHTDGEEVSAGFIAELSLKPNICGKSIYTVSESPQTIRSPDFAKGRIPRNLHCVYHLIHNSQEFRAEIHIKIKSIDLSPGVPEPSDCNKDILRIESVYEIKNISVGKDYVLDPSDIELYNSEYEQLLPPKIFEYCGVKKDVDLYIENNVIIHLQTSPEQDALPHKGIEIEIVNSTYCGRNYTENQGRIKTPRLNQALTQPTDCYTLITAYENQTISIYFLKADVWNDGTYLEIYDGNNTSANKLATVQSDTEDIAYFSTGRYVMLFNKVVDGSYYSYDLNYVATDKGRGCGGSIHNSVGLITSPLYPNIYRREGSCEWQLETPPNTKLRLHFEEFDLGVLCDQNYIQLVNKEGHVVSTYCSETPADYISKDNYVKIIFITSMNNGGTGWVARFVGVL